MESISTEQWIVINSITKHIHADDLRTLPAIITSELRELVPYSHSLYHYSFLAGEIFTTFDYGSIDLPEEHIKLYQEEYEGIDYINWFADEVTPRVFRDTDIIPAQIRENSQLMKGWMEPYHLFYSIGITIAADTCPYGNIYLFRSKDEGDFSDAEVSLLEVINEHLCIRYRREMPRGLSGFTAKCGWGPFSAKYQLTEREGAIVSSIGNGCLRKDLPATLFVSENTLKKHLSNIYKKLGINHYEELMQLIKNDSFLEERTPPSIASSSS